MEVPQQQQFWNGFLASFSLILASELGDKTFLTTAIFSLEHPRMAVFLSSMFALTTMNILSILLGVLTTNIPPMLIHYISISLFAIFGFKMIIEGYQMNSEETIDDEMKKVEQLIVNNDKQKKLEEKQKKQEKEWLKEYSYVCLKIFSLIFLTEWGDKSQLSTILLAAKEGYLAVGLGSFFGNFISNSIACLCSRVISKIISVRTVQIIGGTVFVGCSILKLFS